MHFPSEFMLSHMALAEAGIWATRVNDGREVVFVVRLSTDAIKWIHRGVPVNLVIGHVSIEGVAVRVLALEIFDCLTNPLILNLTQVQTWEIEEFDALLAQDRFTAHFHNEQPLVSVLDATATLSASEIKRYLEERLKFKFLSSLVPSNIFRKAQDAFEKALSRTPGDSDKQVQVFRFPLSLTNMHWNSMTVPDAGTFVPADSDEGDSHEALLLHLLKPHFDGRVIASPQIPDGNKARELCDLLAISKDGFLFEAKAFSVFDKPLHQASDRKAATVMKHFKKALGQLKGAVKRIVKGVEVQSGVSSRPLAIVGTQFRTVHGIVVVSNTHFDLPWLEIGKQLAEAQDPPRIFYHFMELAEVQSMVAFSKGSSEKLNKILVRRAKMVALSRNAHIHIDFVPEATGEIKLPAVNGRCLGLRFVWLGADVADSLVQFFEFVYQQFQFRDFSGRLDFYHKIGKVRGSPAIGIGIVAQPISDQLDRDWWSQLQHDLFDSMAKAGLPHPVEGSALVQTLDEIFENYPELLLSVEFHDGTVTAKRSYEDT